MIQMHLLSDLIPWMTFMRILMVITQTKKMLIVFEKSNHNQGTGY